MIMVQMGKAHCQISCQCESLHAKGAIFAQIKSTQEYCVDLIYHRCNGNTIVNFY